MTDEASPTGVMSRYEQKRWAGLEQHWQKKQDRKALLPPKARAAIGRASESTKTAAKKAGRKIAEVTPDRVKDVGGVVVDSTLEPTIKAVVSLVDLAADLVTELNDPNTVLEFHQKKGRDVTSLDDLRGLDLEHLDEFSRLTGLRWRAFGAAEGAAMGALAFIPAVGTIVAIPADALVIHLVSTALATRMAYTYGIDARDEDQRHHIDRMVKNAYAQQAAKVGTVSKAARAYDAGKGRVKWSNKLREDHRILDALERLMKAAGRTDSVPVGKVVSKMPAIGVVTSAGLNAHTLGSVAINAKAYGQTLHLVERHGLALPEFLKHIEGPDIDDTVADEGQTR